MSNMVTVQSYRRAKPTRSSAFPAKTLELIVDIRNERAQREDMDVAAACINLDSDLSEALLHLGNDMGGR